MTDVTTYGIDEDGPMPRPSPDDDPGMGFDLSEAITDFFDGMGDTIVGVATAGFGYRPPDNNGVLTMWGIGIGGIAGKSAKIPFGSAIGAAVGGAVGGGLDRVMEGYSDGSYEVSLGTRSIPAGVIKFKGITDDGDSVWLFDTFTVTYTRNTLEGVCVDIVGSDRHDWITGCSRSNTFTGLGGNDYMNGYGGADVLDGGMGGDSLLGGYGNDLLLGGGGWDVLAGGNSSDDLRGGTGYDTLWGQEGWDDLRGGAASDILYGGAHADTFWFSVTRDGGDVVRDFQTGMDDVRNFGLDGIRTMNAGVRTGIVPAGADGVIEWIEDNHGNRIEFADSRAQFQFADGASADEIERAALVYARDELDLF